MQAVRRADRLMQLIQVLRRARGPITAATISRELEVTIRTVYRDIASLIGNRVPVLGEAGVGYVLGEGFDLPPLMFTPDELEALMLGARIVQQRGDTSLSDAAADAVAKIAAVVPKALRPILLDAPLMSPTCNRPLAERIDAALIRKALREQRKLQISYEDEKGVKTERTIWPVVLGYLEDRRLLVAWCEMRQGFRNFRTDRMREATILAARLPEHRDRLFKRWWEEEWLRYSVRVGDTSRSPSMVVSNP